MRQVDLAAAAGVSDSTVSLVERGHWEKLSFGTMAAVAAALDIRLDVVGYWRGGDAARLLNAAHSQLAEEVAATLTAAGWQVHPEVSFSVYGERGVVDLIAIHEATGHMLIIELKTDLVDVNELMGTFDRKLRLARAIAQERGWLVGAVSAWLIVVDTSTNRRRAAAHRNLLRARFREDGRAMRKFLVNPAVPTSGIAFWADSNGRRAIQGRDGHSTRERVRKRG
jgi:transcriptional regulator with XRE-family HTH domain